VREAVFNALTSMDALQGASVLDLYAGSGALGIEALSRGAARCTFVERARPALASLRRNLDSTGLASRAEVVPVDAESFLRTTRQRFDLALLDPPYAFDGWPNLLATLPADLAVIESDREIAQVTGWDVLRSRRYGATVVTFARRAASSE
jgi:16S rRNA (guanine966-N2)-methyltransferase